jgi:membrane protease subunit HflK
VVINAEGETGRFLSVYDQYSKSKRVTKKRIYLETMEKIYHDTDKIIVDKQISKSGVTSYLPLNDLSKMNNNTTNNQVKNNEQKNHPI